MTSRGASSILRASWENRVKGATYTDKVSKMPWADDSASTLLETFRRILCIAPLESTTEITIRHRHIRQESGVRMIYQVLRSYSHVHLDYHCP